MCPINNIISEKHLALSCGMRYCCIEMLYLALDYKKFVTTLNSMKYQFLKRLHELILRDVFCSDISNYIASFY